MILIKPYRPRKFAMAVFWIMFLSMQVACSSKAPQTLSGKVLDEHGHPLQGVAVRACYSGWGWGDGGLVWDKSGRVGMSCVPTRCVHGSCLDIHAWVRNMCPPYGRSRKLNIPPSVGDPAAQGLGLATAGSV